MTSHDMTWRNVWCGVVVWTDQDAAVKPKPSIRPSQFETTKPETKNNKNRHTHPHKQRGAKERQAQHPHERHNHINVPLEGHECLLSDQCTSIGQGHRDTFHKRFQQNDDDDDDDDDDEPQEGHDDNKDKNRHETQKQPHGSETTGCQEGTKASALGRIRAHDLPCGLPALRERQLDQDCKAHSDSVSTVQYRTG